MGLGAAALASAASVRLWPPRSSTLLSSAGPLGCAVFFPFALFAATLSLLPGTLSVRVDGGTLHLHVLDARRPVVAEAHEAQRRIARMLRLPS